MMVGLSPLLGIEILIQFFLAHLGLNTIGRYFAPGDPDERVENGLAEIIIAPVVVEMAAGETKPASAVGALDRPHHRFHASAGCNDVIVGPLGMHIRSLANGIAWLGDEDRRELRALLQG